MITHRPTSRDAASVTFALPVLKAPFMITALESLIVLLFILPAAALGQNSSLSRDGHAASRDRITTFARTLRQNIGIHPEDAVRQMSIASRVVVGVEREVDRYVS